MTLRPASDRILSAGTIGFASAGLIAGGAAFGYSVTLHGWNAVFEVEGGAMIVAIFTVVILCAPGMLIGLPVMFVLWAMGARSGWFAFPGIAIAGLVGAFAETGRTGMLDPFGGAICAAYVALACGITILTLHRRGAYDQEALRHH